MHRVVITGLGVVSPVGNGIASFWRSLASGTSGIGPITCFDASSLAVRIGGEVRMLDSTGLHDRFPDSMREHDRKVFMGLAAAEEAMAHAGLGATRSLPRCIVEVGVGLEEVDLAQVVRTWHVLRGKSSVSSGPGCTEDTVSSDTEHHVHSPVQPLQTPLDRLAVLLGRRYGIGAGLYTNCSACAAGAQAIGHAFHLLREGACDLALAGGADSMLNPLGVGGFSLLHALSVENDTPTAACRPFTRSRAGTVLSEGAAFVVLETLEHARGRGARPCAEVLGYGGSLDAFRVSDPCPDGAGAILSMQRALSDAGIGPDQVDHVNTHGTGTSKNDLAETLALKTVLGGRAREVPCTAIKSMTGHMIAASGAAEVVASVLTLEHNLIPPTINLDDPDPQCDLDYVPGAARSFTGTTVLSNSFGFGGQNACVVLRRWLA